jgi:alpha-L-fucosidase
MKRSHALLTLALGFLSVRTASAQLAPKELTATQVGETIAQRDARMGWWRDARFGLFIHWNPSSLKGTEISISRSPNPYGPNPGGIPAAEYDALYKRFNPTQFDAKAVVALAKAAGMKYVVFTTKHHDGFAMFDSALTDYKITSPQPDLHHPDYDKNRARYNQYFHQQVHELLTNYGQVDGIWFDGLGGSAESWDAENLFRQMKADNPRLIINDRCGLPGDYYTPEQQIGAYDDRRDWETCMTIGDQWAYKPGDRYKSAAQCIQALARCSGGDGNFLLNIGLQSDGAVDPTQRNRLEALAAWTKKNGEAIYGSRGGPFKPARYYASTRKGSTIYVQVFGWKGDEVTLPALPRKVLSSRVLGGGTAKVTQGEETLTLRVPAQFHDKSATVVALQLDGSAMDLEAISPSTVKAITTTSVVYRNDITYDATKAFDGDPGTRWATPDGAKSAWWQAQLMKPRLVKEIEINEAFAGRVQRFRIEYQSPGSPFWKTLLEGKQLGESYKTNFPPVMMRSIRLNILDATQGPTISEITLN